MASRFIGRERELGWLEERSPDERLVTILGSPGIGKTTLAKELARRSPLESCFVDASAARDRPSFFDALSRALEVPLSEAQPARALAALASAIDGRSPCLIVIDNFEQLVESCRDDVGELVRLAPRATVLVTSRQALRLPDETRLELGPLDVGAEHTTRSEALDLWVARVRRVRPDYDPNAELETVRRIVTALDGIPLAIELAATRMNVMTAPELWERLRDRFALLGASTRYGSDRRETLEEAIDWSWKLLSPSERSALAACAFFVEGFDLAAAEAAIEVEQSSVVDLVSALRDQSWLVASDRGSPQRFYLYATIREFVLARGRELVDEGALTLRMARHFAERVRPLVDRAELGDRVAVEALDRERGNLLVVADRLLASRRSVELASELLLAAGALIETHGVPSRYDELLDRAIAARPKLLGRLVVERAALRRQLGDLAKAEEDSRAALDLARDHADLELEGRAIRRLGMLAVDRGEHEAARAWLRDSVAIQERRESERELGIALSSLGRVEYALGERDRALELQLRALDIHARAKNSIWQSLAHGYIAYILVDRGDDAAARAHLEQAIALAHEFGSVIYEAAFRGTLGSLHHAAGGLERALELYRASRDAMRRVGRRRLATLHEGNIACVLHELGELEAADGALSRVIHELADAGDAVHRSFFRLQRACVLADLDRIEEAEHELAEAGSTHRALRGVADGHLALARARRAAREGNPRERDLALQRVRALGSKSGEEGADVRIAERRLRSRLERDAARLSTEARELRIDRDARTFTVPPNESVSLRTRPVLYRMLLRLADERRARPGVAIDAAELIRATWPDEKMSSAAATTRLHATVARLRRAGLDPVLEFVDGGYRLSESCEVRD